MWQLYYHQGQCDNVDVIDDLSCRPNQKLSLIHDYLVQLLVGQENLPNFHIAAINLDENMQVQEEGEKRERGREERERDRELKRSELFLSSSSIPENNS